MELNEFLEKYPPHDPYRLPGHPDEQRLLRAEDGVHALVTPPASCDRRAVPAEEPDEGRHLWVFWPAGIPYVEELAPRVAPALVNGKAKHTNLTGGSKASCGGELWVDPVEADRLYVNGCSGRYGPRTREQLEEAVEVFRSQGFRPESFGWDDDANRPARFMR